MNSRNIAYNVQANRIFLITLVISVVALLISFSVDLSGMHSCRLCKLQRIPYFLIILSSLYGIFCDSKAICFYFLAAISAINIIMACYHLGIQQGLFIDPCLINHPTNKEALKQMLFEHSIPCSKVTLSIAGLPMSAWNCAASMVCLGIPTKFLIIQKRLCNKL